MTPDLSLRRRDLLATGAATAGFLAFGPNFWRSAFAAPAVVGDGPYGPLQAPDANGLALPSGFRSRLVARGKVEVAGTGYAWHTDSDGQAAFAEPDGGWILVSNSETLSAVGGGCSSIRFAPDGTIRGAQRIASTSVNCAGGPTPWGTWLSCEEHGGGLVWECDPLGRFTAQSRPAMGTFTHEAVTVDPAFQCLYMTEDRPDGCIYRFTPTAYPDLRAGRLEVAVIDGQGATTWAAVPDPAAIGVVTRKQVAGAATFAGGEGIWFDSGVVYFSTKGDHKLHGYDTRTGIMETLYDPATGGSSGFLTGPDNVTVSRSGDLFVCEDNGQDEFDIVMMTPDRTLSSFVRAGGEIHHGSELSGVTFAPDGEHMYFASQRAYGAGNGAIYEITGPFRAARRDWGGGGPAVTLTGPLPNPPAPQSTQVLPPAPPVVAPPPEQDVDAPTLRLVAPKRLSLAALRTRGLTVKVTTDEAAALAVTVRTSDLSTEPGRRGSVAKPKLTTLDTKKRTATAPGTVKVHLVVSAARAARAEKAIAAAKRKRRRPQIALRVTVQARDRHGNVAIANRTITVTGPLRPPSAKASGPAAS